MRQAIKAVSESNVPIQLLVWEDNGFWVHFKRLEKGSIDWPEPSDKVTTMNLTLEDFANLK